MRVDCGVLGVGLAVVLLLTGCSGKPKVAHKDLADADPVVRSDAAVRLGESRSPEAVDSLVTAIDDPEGIVRVDVIRALGEIGDRRAVRANAATALGQIGDLSNLPFLIRALEDPYFKVRCLAAHSIAMMAQGDAGARTALTDEKGLVMNRAVEAIDKIKGT